MRVAITGSTGFIGKNLVEFYSGRAEVLGFRRGDNLSNLVEFKPDYLFHCAGETEKQELMFSSNVELTYNLLELSSKRLNLKNFIYVGSSTEYSQNNFSPVDVYASTKACGSMLCMGFGRSVKTLIVKPYSLYGTYDREHRFIPKLYNCYDNSEKISIYDGTHDWLDIRDFVNALDIIKDNRLHRIIPICSGKKMSNEEVFNIFCQVNDIFIEHEKILGFLNIYDNNNWFGDNSILRSLGWEQKITIRQGLLDYFNWRRACESLQHIF